TVNLLAKLTSTGAVKAGTGDTNVAVFVVTSGAGTTGSASLTASGPVLCVMDSTTSNTEGFYVIASTTTAGRWHAQSAQPSGVFVVGTMISNATTSGSTATVAVNSSFLGSITLSDSYALRICSMVIGSDNGSALANADIGPQSDWCTVNAAATVVEVRVKADA